MTESLSPPKLPTDEEARVSRIAAKCKEAIGLTSDDPNGDAALEQTIVNFILQYKKPPAEIVPPPAEVVGDALPNPPQPATPIIAVDIHVDETTRASEPTPPLVSDEDDPTRPHFGEKQVRSMDGLRAGMKLYVRGEAKSSIECHEEENISVGKIANSSNTDGEVTVVSAPFAVDTTGRRVLIVKYKKKAWFNDEAIEKTARIISIS